MRRYITTAIVLVSGFTFCSTAVADDTPPSAMVRPHDLDREVRKFSENVYFLTLDVGETTDLDARGLTRVMIDETRIADLATTKGNKRVLIKAKQTGKAVIHLVFKDGTASTFIIVVNEAVE